jgi:hypothetical protein
MEANAEIKRLDELITKLGGDDAGMRSCGPCALLLEHLRAARRDRLGAMAGEYRVSLRLAKASVSCIPDKGARTEVKDSLRNLLDAESTGK